MYFSVKSQNTHFLLNHYTADLLFDWFGFSRIAYIVFNYRFTCLVEPKLVKREVSCTK